MHSVKSEPLKYALQSVEEDVLVKEIILTHDSDARQINSASLLRAIQDIMFYTTSSLVSRTYLEATVEENDRNDVVGLDEALGHTIYSISSELLYKCSEDGDLHARTMTLFDLLGNFKLEAKVVLVLAAFAASYGEFWLVSQLHPLNPLAVALAMLKQLPRNLSAFGSRFKALTSLVKTMVDVTKCIIKYEGLRMQQLKLDKMAIVPTKSLIYIAAYWVIRSCLTCSSLITDMIANTNEQVNLTLTTNAAWELSSLVYKMSNIRACLQKNVDMYHLQIEDTIHRKLLSLFEENQIDNQEALCTLFGLRDDMPLKDGSSQKVVGVSELVNKVVLLLISKPYITSTNELLFLVQQTSRSQQLDDKKRSHEIVWIPISSSSWPDMEIELFTYLSNKLPWYSLRQPWLLSLTAVNYIKQAWKFVDEPLVVVLDSRGTVTSTSAMDMIFIWGTLAYPYSVSREEELWQETKWSLQLVIGEIDPLLSLWVEEGRPICLYGSEDIEWIREFTSTIKNIISSTGIQLELVYVGIKQPSESITNILAAIARGGLSYYLSYHNIQFFWLRLESMIRSKLRLAKTLDYDEDQVLKEVSLMISHDTDGEKCWALWGEGTSSATVQLRGNEVGFLEALIRSVVEAPEDSALEKCSEFSVVPYSDKEGWSEGNVVLCEKCKRPMEKLVFYQCQGDATSE